MKITENKAGNITILKAEGRLDATNAKETEQRLSGFIDQDAKEIVLDLSGVDYISSAGLRALLVAAKQAQKTGGKLSLAAPAPQARKILDTAGFSSIIPVFDTIEEACGKLVTQNTNDNSGPDKLSLAEEIYLMALDDEQGVLKPLPAEALNYALAGALLMELALENRVDPDLSELNVISPEPTGDPLLDDTLAEIRQSSAPKPVSFWLKHFAGQSGSIEERVLARLIQKKILKQENRKILWVFETRRYPMIDNREVKEVRARLRDLITSNEIPDARDIVLISLCNACRLLHDMFPEKEYEKLRPRIENLARLDLIGQEISRAIREIEQAMTAAMLSSGGNSLTTWC